LIEWEGQKETEAERVERKWMLIKSIHEQGRLGKEKRPPSFKKKSQ